jgi:transposase
VSDLIQKLTCQSVIVMDNATFHKRQDIIEAITNAGHIVLFFPTYSPDLNPIENKWAQAKAIKRRTECNIDELFEKFEI